MTFNIPKPEPQIAFARALVEIRASMLQDALKVTVRKLDIPSVDKELASIVPPNGLAILASHGLRGEYFFPVPLLLKKNPRLLGYYRLLYGFSQKEFYHSRVAGQFKSLEMHGKLSDKSGVHLNEFCIAMSKTGILLLTGISTETITPGVLDDLTLLTLGPQLRGNANVKIGIAAIAVVFGLIREVVHKAVIKVYPHRIELKNAAGRTVLIELAADPDIVIREALPSGAFRHVVAIEVKGGRDFANIHNRIGEAEKSHQKARTRKFTECWTVVNVDNMNVALAEQESPSTDRFYRISSLVSASGEEFDDFRDRVISLTGVAR